MTLAVPGRIRALKLMIVLVPVVLLVHHGSALAAGRCEITGTADVSSKLLCPGQVVEIEYRLRVACQSGATPQCVRSVRLTDELPSGLVAEDEIMQADPGPWTLEITDGLDGPLTASRSARAERPGSYEVGGASLELVADDGSVDVTRLRPVTVTVVPDCPDGTLNAVFLPIAHRAPCIAHRLPIDLVVAVDRSASIAPGMEPSAGRVSDLAVPVERLIDGLDWGHDRAALVGFDRSAELLVPLGTDRDGIHRALAALSSGHGTRIGPAIDRAVEAFQTAGPSAGESPAADGADRAGGARRSVLLLVTDGVSIGPSGSDTARRAARRARRAGIRILALALGPAPDTSLLGRLVTPGTPVLQATRPDQLADRMRTMAHVSRCGR